MTPIFSVIIVPVLLLSLITLATVFVISFISTQYRNNAPSQNFDASLDMALLHTTIEKNVTDYMSAFITKGKIDSETRIQMSRIPLSDDEITTHLKEIYTLISGKNGMLCQRYLDRIQYLYIGNLEGYIKLAIKNMYDDVISELKLQKKIIATGKLDAKYVSGINRYINVSGVLKGQYDIDDDTVIRISNLFGNMDNETLLKYHNSEMESTRDGVRTFLIIKKCLADNKVDIPGYIDFINGGFSDAN